MLSRRISHRSLVTLALSLGCMSLAVMWPGWLTAFRAEGSYGDEASVAGNVALSTFAVQSTNISIRLGALRGTGPEPGSRAASADRSRFGGFDVFLNGLGGFGDQGTTSRETGFDFRTAGFTLGGDYKMTDNLVLGAAFGYTNTRADLARSAGELTTNGYSLSGFGSYYIGKAFYVDGIATFGWNTYDIERNGPGINETSRAHPDGHQYALSVGAGYNWSRGALTVGPLAKVNYLSIRIDDYREGGSASSVKFDSQHIESLTTDLGGQVSYALSVPWGVLSPMAQFVWEHEFKNDSRDITGTFVNAPTTAFLSQTNNPDRDYFKLGTGLTSTFRRGITGFFYYESVLGRDHFTSHSFTAGVRIELD